jgi:Ca2+-binding RTX toxin-like protein
VKLVIRPDGTGERQLTNNDAKDDHPAWSPDGSKIVFTSHRTGGFDIWVMNVDGSGADDLTSNFAGPDQIPSWQALCTQIGTDGPDVLTGTAGVDVLCGFGGNDELMGLGGKDVLLGGDGNDTISGGDGSDASADGLDDDTISGEAGDDRLNVRDEITGNDTVRGGLGGDVCIHDAGDVVHC